MGFFDFFKKKKVEEETSEDVSAGSGMQTVDSEDPLPEIPLPEESDELAVDAAYEDTFGRVSAEKNPAVPK